MGVAFSGGRLAHSPRKAYFVEFMGAEGFWLLVFYEISRTQFLNYSHFQGVKLKLRSRAFCWCIVCFCTSIGSFQILSLKIFRNILLHPVDENLLIPCKKTPREAIFGIKDILNGAANFIVFLENFLSKKVFHVKVNRDR